MMHFQTKTAAPVTRWFLLAAMSLVLSTNIAGAQTFTPRDENPEDFPAGPGRDETFYTCTACHGFKLVAAQGMNRRQWDDSINWMMERHRMPPLDTREREIVLNYLEATFPPRAPSGGGGFQNPFMKR
jgi:hypothetical protein